MCVHFVLKTTEASYDYQFMLVCPCTVGPTFPYTTVLLISILFGHVKSDYQASIKAINFKQLTS